MLVIYLVIPESPCESAKRTALRTVWAVTRGNEAQAKALLTKVYKSTPDFDAERQYDVLRVAVAYEKELAAEHKREKWYNIFRGVDGFRTIVSTWALFSQQLLGLTLVGQR